MVYFVLCKVFMLWCWNISNIKHCSYIQFSHTSKALRVFNVMKCYCKIDWQYYFVPEVFCQFQTYRSNVEALSHAVTTAGLLPLTWRSLLVALGSHNHQHNLCASTHSAKYVWPNEHIKSFTVKAYVDFIFFLNAGLKSLWPKSSVQNLHFWQNVNGKNNTEQKHSLFISKLYFWLISRLGKVYFPLFIPFIVSVVSLSRFHSSSQ